MEQEEPLVMGNKIIKLDMYLDRNMKGEIYMKIEYKAKLSQDQILNRKVTNIWTNILQWYNHKIKVMVE